MRRGWSLVRVAGQSMSPAVRDGDVLLVRWGHAARPGQVVLARWPGSGLACKRAVRTVVGERWWLLGDNTSASDDSRRLGPGEVLAAVVLRVRPQLRRVA